MIDSLATLIKLIRADPYIVKGWWLGGGGLLPNFRPRPPGAGVIIEN